MFCSKITLFPLSSYFKTSSRAIDDSVGKHMYCSIRGPSSAPHTCELQVQQSENVSWPLMALHSCAKYTCTSSDL